MKNTIFSHIVLSLTACIAICSCSQPDRGTLGPMAPPESSPANDTRNDEPEKKPGEQTPDEGGEKPNIPPITLPRNPPQLLGNLCLQTFNIYGPIYAQDIKKRTKALLESIPTMPVCEIWQIQELWNKGQNKLLSEGMTNYNQVNFDKVRAKDHQKTGISSFFSKELNILGTYGEVFKVNNNDGILDWFRRQGNINKSFGVTQFKHPALPEPIVAINLHTHPQAPEIRVAQIIQLIQSVIKQMPLPGALLVSGDFNAKPDSIEMALMRDVLLLRDTQLEFRGGSYGDICTYCQNNPLAWDKDSRVIDYVLVRSSPGMSFRIIESKVNLQDYKGITLSDHYGMRTDFEVYAGEPTFMDVENAEYQRRIEAAIQSLAKAKDLISEKGSEKLYKETILTINAIQGILRGKDFDHPFQRYFRMQEVLK